MQRWSAVVAARLTHRLVLPWQVIVFAAEE